MLQIFLTIIVFCLSEVFSVNPLHKEPESSYRSLVSINSVLLFQPESLDAGDESALKPFEGFTILSIAGILLTLAVVVFVVFKVMKAMNRRE